MKTFCVLPFYATVINGDGYQRPCCHWMGNDFDVARVQSQMLSDQRPQECAHCWRLEDAGIASDRQQKNQHFDWFLDTDIEQLQDRARHGQNQTVSLNIMTSSVCNSTCVSCGSGCSSSWAELESRWRGQRIPITPAVDLSWLFETYDFDQLRFVSLMGGEPLYEPRNWQILQRLQGQKTFVSIVTNGTVDLKPHQLDLLASFEHLNLCVSIDGVQNTYEYLRYPSKWTKLLENLALFRDRGIDISAHYTVSNISLFTHNETMSWFSQQQIPVTVNPIEDPAWLAPHQVTPQARAWLQQQLTPQDAQAYLGQQASSELLQQFRQELAWQDQAKGVSFEKLLPDTAKWF